jgi:6-phosphofructokinase 1
MGKSSKIVIVAEGDETGGGFKVSENIKKKFPAFDVRVTVLGHTQRGGNPTFLDRQNASILGYEAVQELNKGNSGIMLGFLNGQLSHTPFEKVKKHNTSGIEYMLKIAQVLAR